MYDIKLHQHHNALDDAKTCFGILRKFEMLYPDAVVSKPYCYETVEKSTSCGWGIESIYSDKTKEMQKLQLLVSKIIEDSDCERGDVIG